MNSPTSVKYLSRGAYLVEIRCSVAWNGPLHIGTGERLSVMSDSPVLHEGRGQPYLPGSSIRGVLRDWCLREASLLGVEPETIEYLFGPGAKRPEPPGSKPAKKKKGESVDRQGRLTVHDCLLKDAHTEVRDHVCIDPDFGAAARRGKFDQEVAFAQGGEIRLVYQGDGPNDPELILLKSCVQALELGLLAFGGKVGWGLGHISSASIQWRDLDRSQAQGLHTYLLARLKPSEGPAVNSLVLPAAVSAKPARKHRPEEPKPLSWLRLELNLQFEGPVLVKGLYRDQGENREVKSVYQTSPDNQPVLMGSSLRGPLRAQARHIEPKLASLLFGERRGVGKRGLLRISEGRLVKEVKDIRSTHVAVDRILGFSAKEKLFDDVALASPCFRVSLTGFWLPESQDQTAAMALLLFVLRDTEQKLLWAGSQTTRGYGHIVGVAIHKVQYSLVNFNDSLTDLNEGRRYGRQEMVTVVGPTPIASLAEPLACLFECWTGGMVA